MSTVHLLWSSKPGARPQEKDLRRRGLALNLADRLIFYRDKDGKVAQWSAAAMPDELWDRFANGFQLQEA
jgi:hypothetical protein